jgi:hypothetical protein
MSADAYFLEIEAHFAMRRNTPFILSAKDWALMRKWHEEGVPLPIVIEAIDTVFEKNESSGRRKVISSLSYCRHAVKELWEERRELFVGGSELTPESSPAARLDTLAGRLEATPFGAPFAEAVRALASEKSIPRIEQLLMEIEREMMEVILATPSEEIDSLRREMVSTLGDTSRLDPKIRERTVEANLRRLIRERFNLPRLTLFG